MTSIGLVLKLALYTTIIGILVKLWRDLFVDSFRQNIFTLRDELFDYAAEGNISFEHPAYKDLRLAMNSVILYAEKITFLRWVFALIVNKYAPDPVATKYWHRMVNSIASLGPGQRDHIARMHMRFQTEIGRHMIYKSPLLLTGWIFYSIESAVKSALNRAQSRFATRIKTDVIEIEAMKYRRLAEAEAA
jgi:hypothetical protein